MPAISMYAAPARDKLFLGKRVHRQGLDALGGEGHRRLGRHLVCTRGHQGGDRGGGRGAGAKPPDTICDYLGADSDGARIVLHGLHLRFLLTVRMNCLDIRLCKAQQT